MRHRLLILVLVLAALTLNVASVSAQRIGVYFDTAGTICATQIPPFTPTTWYIIADPGVRGGFEAAEFRLDGAAASWFMSATSDPAASVVIGSPILGGTYMSYPTCQNGPRVLFTINGFAAGVVANNLLTVREHTTPSDPALSCPWLEACPGPSLEARDGPVFDRFCATGGQAMINGGPFACSSALPTLPSTWGRVKSLYR